MTDERLPDRSSEPPPTEPTPPPEPGPLSQPEPPPADSEIIGTFQKGETEVDGDNWLRKSS